MSVEVPPEPEKKKAKTGAIIGTVAAIVLCGLPGLCLLCPGSIAIFAGAFNASNNLPDIESGWGTLPLCLSVLFIAIAVVVPVVTLRKKKPAKEAAPAEEGLPPDEPLPPAS